MIKIISFKICPFVQRVTALLEAKGLAYDIDYIELKHKPQWFLQLSPHGQVPVLLTESGIALFESEAIMEYIDDISSPLQPDLTPEQKALQRAWGYQASKLYLSQCSAMRSPDIDSLQQRSQVLNEAFVKIESALGPGPYFTGTELSNVDIAWLPLLHRAAIIEKHRGYDFLQGFERMQTWQQQLLTLDIVQNSVAEDFEALFCDFYLSDKTYLGTGKDCQAIANSGCGESNCCP